MKNCGLILLLFLFFGIATSAQPGKPVYRNLVMEGGGIRGIAYGGALAELEKQGVLPEIKRVGGTSAGAIQALLLALGYTPEEISRITYETNVKEFADGRMIFFGGFHRMARKFGWYRGEKFTKWLGKLVEQKTGKADLTFAELHALAGSRGFRDLYVTGTNLSRQQLVILSYETYQEMKVRDAVRISMSIPLFFQAVGIDKAGKVVALTKKNVPEVDILVDGGIIGNFPIQLFDHNRYLTATGKDTAVINPETIGLRLDRPEQIAYDSKQSGLAPYQITNFNGYMGAFYNMVLENLNRSTLKSEDWQRTISINTLQFAPKIRKMSVAEKELLLKSGEQAVKTYFGS